MSMYPGTGEHCNTCGRPWLYVGDVPAEGYPQGQEPWCTCTQAQPDTGTAYVQAEPGIMYTNWCVICWPDKQTPAEMIFRGSSLCPACFRKALDYDLKKQKLDK